MKLLLHCNECSEDLRKPLLVEVEDEGVYRVSCENGHQFMHTLSNAKFEILFEMALLALLDGYTREAVATLAAAVEEFYRFFIKIVLAKRGMYEGEKFKELEAFWRVVSLSERQLGAFSILHLLEKGKVATFPDRWSTEFRNEVVHKGRIPKYDEVVRYGERITAFLVPLWKEYQQGHDHLIAIGMDIVGTFKEEDRSLSKSGSWYPTTINRLVHLDEPSFERAVQLVKENAFLSK
jgi:hypothetical protein